MGLNSTTHPEIGTAASSGLVSVLLPTAWRGALNRCEEYLKGDGVGGAATTGALSSSANQPQEHESPAR